MPSFDLYYNVNFNKRKQSPNIMNMLLFNSQFSSYNNYYIIIYYYISDLRLDILRKLELFWSFWYRHTCRFSNSWSKHRFLETIVRSHREISCKRRECMFATRSKIHRRSLKGFIIRAIRARDVADRREIKPGCSVNCWCTTRNENFPCNLFEHVKIDSLARCPCSHNEVRIFQRDFQRDVFMRHFDTRTFSRQVLLQLHAWKNKIISAKFFVTILQVFLYEMN